ncbi:MAG: ABC transporter permease subunit/CPBP intramembrane protease [Peptostreptococcaceae bacterium]|nr:ABC transporter permease subunit/CPBP intramembrane protease [Peptostreptococcaceae bacterium]
MNKKAIFTLYKREMLDILRDKKTVFMNVFVPIILYPLITILASQVMMSVQNSLNEQTYQIAIVSEHDAVDEMQRILGAEVVPAEAQDSSPEAKDQDQNTTKSDPKRSSVSQDQKSKAKDIKEETPISKNETAPDPARNGASNKDKDLRVQIVSSEDPEADLKNKEIHAYIEVKEAKTADAKASYQIHYVASNVNSSTVTSFIQKKLEIYQEELRIQKLQEMGIEYDKVWDPIEIGETDHATQEQSIGSILGGIIPLLMIMGLVNGASNTAIDTTAGEKQRGTLETTFSFPVTRREIITSKFSAVATMASVSVLLNFLSIGVMGYYMYSLINSVASPDLAPTIDLASFLPAVLIMLVCVILFAIFISALSLALYSNAQSPKEAGIYATPIMLVTILVSYIGFIPNLDLSIKTALVPVVNVVLLIKSILIFEYDITLILMALVSNLAYGFLAIHLMYSVFEREDILFGEDSRFFRIFESRANIKPGGIPNIGEAIFVLILGLMGMIYIGSYFQIRFGFWGILSIQIIIFTLAVGYALYAKFDLKKVFSLKLPRASHVIGSILLWIGTLMIVALLSLFLSKIFPQSMEGLEMMEEMFSEQSLLSLLLVVALAPAICEEVLFRGFVYSAFRKRFSPYAAMFFVSIFFGLYHMSLIKFFTTALLGFALNYSMHRSGSIITSSVMHFLNNALSVTALYFSEKLMKFSETNMTPEMAEAEMMSQANPFVMIGVIALFIIGGVLLLNTKPEQRMTETNRSV